MPKQRRVAPGIAKEGEAGGNTGKTAQSRAARAPVRQATEEGPLHERQNCSSSRKGGFAFHQEDGLACMVVRNGKPRAVDTLQLEG